MSRNLVVLLAIIAVGLTGCSEEIFVPANGTIYGDLSYADGTPASGIHVMVEGSDLIAVSDIDGRFVIGDVLAVDEVGMGKYYVVRGYGHRDAVPVGFIVTHFKVKGQQSYSVGEVTVKQTGRITGYVKLEGEIFDHSGVVVYAEGTSLTAISRVDGSYTIERVPEHQDYAIVCAKSGYHEMVMPDPDDPDAHPIEVQSGTTTQLEEATLYRQ
jgi:hypothetical protein